MSDRLKHARRAVLAPVFGAAMALNFTAAWLLLGRALTESTFTATLFLTAAATISAGIALLLMRFLRRSPPTARFAAAFVVLAAGTVGLTALIMMVNTVTGAHDLTEVPVRMAVLITTLSTAAALHNFLTVAGLPILPLGLPLIVVFAHLMARKAR